MWDVVTTKNGVGWLIIKRNEQILYNSSIVAHSAYWLFRGKYLA